MSTTLQSTFEEAWHEWHAARERDLATEHGWLSPTALHWLTGEPSGYDDLPGLWWYDDEGIWARVSDTVSGDEVAGGPTLELDGEPIAGDALVWRRGEGPVGRLTHGERWLETFERGGGNHAVRVRDPRSPRRAAFTGVPAFPPDPAWRIEADFVPYEEARKEVVASAAERATGTQTLVGRVHFTVDGQELSLHVSAVLGERAVTFRDATSGEETFGLLRQVRLEDGPDGKVVLDFNRATNPPCSFTPYATCPFPPEGNVLPIPVRAGEKTPTGR